MGQTNLLLVGIFYVFCLTRLKLFFVLLDISFFIKPELDPE